MNITSESKGFPIKVKVAIEPENKSARRVKASKVVLSMGNSDTVTVKKSDRGGSTIRSKRTSIFEAPPGGKLSQRLDVSKYYPSIVT